MNSDSNKKPFNKVDIQHSENTIINIKNNNPSNDDSDVS